jgi:branched-chain amino acid transport system substrate-binding protein
MKSSKSVRIVFLGLVVVLLLGFGINRGLAADPIKIGIIIPLTGDKAKFGEFQKNSFLMALNEINKAGIKGQKIELLIEDDTGKPDVARAAAEKLLTKDNVVMLGGGVREFGNLCHCRCGPAEKNSFPDYGRLG